MAFTVQELALALLNPQSLELKQLLNDQEFCDMLRIAIHHSQHMRGLEQFLEKNRGQDAALRKETRDQALRDKGVMEENARMQQAVSSIPANEKEMLLRQMLEKMNAIIADKELRIGEYKDRITVADEILAAGAADWEMYQQAAAVQAQAVMQHALNNNLILNVNGQPVGAETAARLLANAAPADPMKPVQMYIESIVKAGGQLVNTVADEAVKVLSASTLVQQLNDIFTIGKDVNGVFDKAAFKLRKVEAHEKRDASAPNLKPATTTLNDFIAGEQQNPTSQYKKGVPHKIQTFAVNSRFPELDKVRESHMRVIQDQMQNIKLGEGSADLIENIITRMNATKEKVTCTIALNKLVSEHHAATAQRDAVSNLMSEVLELSSIRYRPK